MSEGIERVSTGIPGLDQLIQGGFIERSSNLITGVAGTGKTIFCAQFLWQGLQEGDKCMFITFEEKPDKIRGVFSDFGWDFEQYEARDDLRINYKDPFDASGGEDFFRFRSELEDYDVDRIALDSTSILSLYYEQPYDIRRNLFKLVEMLSNAGATSVLTTEAPEGEDKLTRYGVEEYLVDAVIKLDILSMGSGSSRSLSVRKMRRTKHKTKSHGLQITQEGLKITS